MAFGNLPRVSKPPPMSAAEYRVILNRRGLDIASAGRMPGATKTDAKRWAAGKLKIPDDVARMLRYLVRTGATPADIQEALDDE